MRDEQTGVPGTSHFTLDSHTRRKDAVSSRAGFVAVVVDI